MQASAENTGTITINNDSLIDTVEKDSKSINVFSRDGDININLDVNSKIIGGGGEKGTAIDMISAAHHRDQNNEKSASQILNNKGVISASNDRTIAAHRSRASGGETIINNDGIINGFVDLSSTKHLNTSTIDSDKNKYKDIASNGDVKFNNNGIWNVKDGNGLSSSGDVGTVINTIGTKDKAGLITNTGTIQIVDSAINSAVLENANVINSRIIDLGKNTADTTLTINGDYHGENG